MNKCPAAGGARVLSKEVGGVMQRGLINSLAQSLPVGVVWGAGRASRTPTTVRAYY
jgi:hypothetical protein